MARAPDAASSPDVEVAIVGGGPAGLVAAVQLARLRHSVTVFDASRSRLASIPRTRNFPGAPDGIPGPELLGRLRQQTSRYPIHHVAAQVEALDRAGAGFRLGWAAGSMVARMVLIATGVSDIAPAMPHLEHALSTGLMRYCPVCDGYEVIDRAVGVIANGPAGVGEALYLRHFTDRLTLFLTSDAAELSAEDSARLASAGVHVAEGRVVSLRGWEGTIRVRHGERESACDSLYCALGLRVHSSLAKSAGASTDESGYILTDRHQATSVDGLYAVGDVALGLNQITVAAGTAATASAAMHLALRAPGRA
jgi:thioredoxin reductase (NADPH)